jgi:NTP pyrophosphatase (non-canonical NTP hydrolase)
MLQLMPEISEWSREQFPGGTPYDPFEGMVEELGELMHARLKGRQQIRGTEAELFEAEVDACCDMLVFLMDLLGRSSVPLDLWAEELEAMIGEMIGWTIDSDSTTILVLAMLKTLGECTDMARGLASAVGDSKEDSIIRTGSIAAMLAGLAILAYLVFWYADENLGVDLADELKRVWKRVKSRNWQENPATGGDDGS